MQVFICLLSIALSYPEYFLDGKRLVISGDGDVDTSWQQTISPINVHSVDINEGIINLLYCCFSGCTLLKTVKLPSSLISIDNSFENTGLESIYIPQGVKSITSLGAYKTKNLVNISVDPMNSIYCSYEFCLYNKDCSFLITGAVGRDTIKIHKNCTRINKWACATPKFIAIDFPDSIEYIGDYAFVDPDVPFQTITFTNNSRLQTLCISAFQRSKINNFLLPPKVNILTTSLFYKSLIKNFTFFPNSNLKVINKHTFLQCNNLEYINLPASINSIDTMAFLGCNNLIAINVESGSLNYKTHNNNLFSSDLSQLVFVPPTTKNLILPKNTSLISQSMLQSYPDLLNVEFEGNQSDYLGFCRGVIYSKNYSVAKYAIGSIEIAIIKNETTIVEESCFSGIEKLKKVVFYSESQCNEFCISAFELCRNLEVIEFPPKLEYIGFKCFSETKLHLTKIPPKVKVIGSYSFGSISYSQFNFSFLKCETSCKINYRAFWYTKFSSITLPEGLLSIDEGAFSNSGASSIQIPSTTSSISQMVFYFMKITTIEFKEGSNLSVISKSLFMGCNSLISVSLPGSVTKISESAFAQCESLRQINWVSEVHLLEIDDMAFTGCKSLEAFDVPGTVTSVIPTAFYKCFSLRTFSVSRNSASVYSDLNGFLIKGSSLCVFPPGREEGYIPESIKVFEERTFYGCSCLKKLDFARESIQLISQNTFFECSNLSSLLLPGTVADIRDKAFESCSKLQTIDISDGSQLTKIGASTFSGCSALQRFNFLGSSILEEIGDSTFSGSNLESFKLPSSIRKVGSSAFAKCAKLKTIEFESDCPFLTALESNCFSQSGIESIIIPSNVKTIGSGCFGYCGGLKNATLPDNLTNIGSSAFAGCGLREIILPLNSKTIGPGAFSSNTHLVRVYYCGNEAFNDSSVFQNSGSPIRVFTLSEYHHETLCGIVCARVMRTCMLLPSAKFTAQANSKALCIETVIMAIHCEDDA